MPRPAPRVAPATNATLPFNKRHGFAQKIIQSPVRYRGLKNDFLCKAARHKPLLYRPTRLNGAVSKNRPILSF
jgi:hypothetical protein